MRDQKGITLIALVITIIVLLILAGVTIAMLSGENGILNRASSTRAENAWAQAKEQAGLALSTIKTEIAYQKTLNGNYNPSGSVSTLASIIKGDLNAADSTDNLSNGWAVTTTNGSGDPVTGAKIILTFNDSSLKSNKVWTINLTDKAVGTFDEAQKDS